MACITSSEDRKARLRDCNYFMLKSINANFSVRRPKSPITGLQQVFCPSCQRCFLVRRPKSPITGLQLSTANITSPSVLKSEDRKARLRDCNHTSTRPMQPTSKSEDRKARLRDCNFVNRARTTIQSMSEDRKARL